MKVETIKQHGEDCGLQGARHKRFIHFFSNRFPNESEVITSYVREWAERFKGDATLRMDKQSQDVYYDYFNHVDAETIKEMVKADKNGERSK